MKSRYTILVLGLVMLFHGCNKVAPSEFISNFSSYNKYIVAFTRGMISAHSDIRLVLASDNHNWKVNEVLDEDIFDISPRVSGKVVALSSNTIAFIPDEKLEAGTEYRVTLNLDKLDLTIAKEEEKLSKFNFIVRTLKQDFNITVDDIQSASAESQYLNCTLKLADNISIETAKKLVQAEQNGVDLPIVFEKVSGELKEFKFKIEKTQRLKTASSVKIIYDGDDLDVDKSGDIIVPISAVNEFKVVKSETEGDSNETLKINFSEPLQKDQNFKGLVSIGGIDNLKFSTHGNVLKVFYDAKKIKTSADDILLEVFQGIESQYGNRLVRKHTEKVVLDQIKPNIKFEKNGTILPSSSNLKLNFEAVNLSAVDVRVYKIYKNNILQFLQFNKLNGGSHLTKVAQTVAKTTIKLNENGIIDTDRWNSFTLDLAKVITPDPGTIYRVELSYKKAYSLYKCDDSEVKEETKEEEDIAEDDINYSGNNNDEYYYEDEYEWGKDSSPCSNSYFYYSKISTNVLASNIGVIAKRGENKSYLFAVNNILTTEPISNAQVDLYTFQQQKIETKNTNKEGLASFQLSKYAYFAIVTFQNQSTYIKLDDGNSLSLSNFDVSGEVLQKGLKGYIYGERGVWRPGDNIYLSFILNDVANKLPISHPIKFRLTDPNGKVTYQTVQKVNELNHYTFIVQTADDAPTGNWEAMVSVGGAKFYKSIKIETIKPNRLKIKTTLENEVLSASYTNSINMDVKWLHGAIAKNLKVEMKAKFTQKTTTFKKFTGCAFDDLTRKFNTEELTVFSGKLDENGLAKVTLNPQIKGQAPGMLNAYLITKVYEEGGDFSMDVTSTTYSPYKFYVGIKSPTPNKYGTIDTGKTNQFNVVTVDEKGNPKPLNGLEVKIYKLEWRWWWNATEDNLSDYISDNSTSQFGDTKKINTNVNGYAALDLEWTDDQWGRYLIRISDEKGGHATSLIVSVDWPEWSGKTRNNGGSTATMLNFSTDKKKYEMGEKAKISIPSSEGGHAFISIENGTRVIQTIWAKTKKGETNVEIPITSEMAPNVYFNVSLLQSHASTYNDSPIRMYGIVPIEVVDKNTILSPKISMPEVLRPEQSFAINVSEQNGKAMTYTIAIVDEGLLDLTNFKTPNAWNSFYVREALGVRTWDVYDDVIGAYGGKTNQIFSIGGDLDLAAGKNKKANRFKPAVVFLGPFQLQKGQTQTQHVKLPKYIGSVRTMIVAANASTSAYGSAEVTTPVRSPLMILASLPRKISPSERVTVPVTVFALENTIKNVTVQITTSKGITVLDNATQNISFTQPEEKMVSFNLEVGTVLGVGKINITATSENEKSSYETEIDVINPNPVTITSTIVMLEPNSSKTVTWNTFGVTGSNKAKVEISSMPAMNLEGRLQYLIQYPHGCVEQTTSSVLPQLYLNDLIDLDAKRQKVIQNNIIKGIERLGSFQLPNGGLSYWQGQSSADDWGTSYAGNFMLEAERKGYTLPINFKSNWISYQRKEAKKWRLEKSNGNDLAQAYRLYTLALADEADLSSMNRLKETQGISNGSKLRLAAAYALAGQKNAGLSLLMESKIEDVNYYYYYGSNDRNRAMILETMLLLNQREQSFEMATKLAQAMSADGWMSTQTAAFCLYSMSKFAQSYGAGGIDIMLNDDGKNQKIKTDKTMVGRDLTVSNASNSITITNNNKNTLYVCLSNSGILPIGEEKVVKNNLFTSIVFKSKDRAINVSKIKQGTEFIAEITVVNMKREGVNNVVLSQILPSGFEIVNTRFTDAGEATGGNNADYIDIRDDRTNFYFNLNASEVKTFRVLLNASYLGKYYLPGTQCEAMYDNKFLARTKGFWVEIEK